MKTKILVLVAMVAILGSVFVGCTKKDEGMTTTKTTAVSEKETTKPSQTKVSEGVSSAVSEVSSDVSKGVTNVSEDISKGMTNVSNDMKQSPRTQDLKSFPKGSEETAFGEAFALIYQ